MLMRCPRGVLISEWLIWYGTANVFLIKGAPHNNTPLWWRCSSGRLGSSQQWWSSEGAHQTHGRSENFPSQFHDRYLQQSCQLQRHCHTWPVPLVLENVPLSPPRDTVASSVMKGQQNIGMVLVCMLQRKGVENWQEYAAMYRLYLQHWSVCVRREGHSHSDVMDLQLHVQYLCQPSHSIFRGTVGWVAIDRHLETRREGNAVLLYIHHAVELRERHRSLHCILWLTCPAREEMKMILPVFLSIIFGKTACVGCTLPRTFTRSCFYKHIRHSLNKRLARAPKIICT